MSTKTKILVFKMKEIIYTIVFAVLAILLIILLVLIIKGHSKKSSESAKKSTFSPGIYEASIVLSSNPVNIEVVVDHEQIKSISILLYLHHFRKLHHRLFNIIRRRILYLMMKINTPQ